MNPEKLLSEMGAIVSALMRGFRSDFTEVDTDFIQRTQAEIPFIWLVRECGTNLCELSDMDDLHRFSAVVDYMDSSRNDYCLYYFDGEKLQPTFPGRFRGWLEEQSSQKPKKTKL